jgi:signal recognition particle receptor subunit beta
MPVVHHARSELHFKLVYYGPGLGGKTTNLEYVHAHTRPDQRGKLIALETEAERTLFFDLLPMELGQFRDYRVRLHVCTVPGQIALDTTRKLVLRNVDGVVFVVDSQEDRLEANIESIRNLELNLRLQGDDPDVLPLVVQYNKRDLRSAMPIDVLRSELLVPPGVVEIEACASTGEGVMETLKAITRECLKLVKDPTKLKEGRSPSIIPGRRPSMYPGSATFAEIAAPVLPLAARVPKVSDDG